MKLKNGFVVRSVGGKTVAVAVGATSRTFHGMITLNGTGKFIWDALEKETTEEKIVDALLEEYEIDRETAMRDVSLFVEKLREQGLILE